MTNCLRITATLAVAAIILAGCGSTRFVVVESDAGGAGTPSAQSTPAGESTAAADVPTAPSGPPTKEDDTAIRKSIAEALAVDDRPMSKRLPYLEAEAEDLVPTYDAVRKVVSGLTVKILVDKVETGGDDATATVSVTVDGATFASGLPVTLGRSEGKWKVTRDGACTLLALASPCPERA
jgi:hypothetical protein